MSFKHTVQLWTEWTAHRVDLTADPATLFRLIAHSGADLIKVSPANSAGGEMRQPNNRRPSRRSLRIRAKWQGHLSTQQASGLGQSVW
jgi:hypothetical protein